MAFDAVGELAAQPGGQELSALVTRVQQVDPEVLHGMGRRLGSMVEGVDGSLRAVRRHGDDVQAAWRGRGAEAFAGYLDDVGRAGTRTLDAAGRIRVRIDDAGRELAVLRGEVDAQVSRALDAARRVRSEALADPARAPLADQLAAQAMAGPTAAARTAVERAETALGDAARALREMTTDVVGFSRLPAPDARPIAPVSGEGPLGWSAITAGESLATVPASVDGDGGTQGIDLDGGGASSEVSSVSESSAADNASGASGGESECSGSEGSDAGELSPGGGDASVSEASDVEESGSGGVGDSSDLGEDFLEEESDAGGADASVSEASGAEESGSGDAGDSSDRGEGSDSGGGDASVSEASASEDSGSGGVGDSSDLGEDFLEEGSSSGGGDASVSEASGAEDSGSGGVGDSSDLGDDFLEDSSDADAATSDDAASEGEDDDAEGKDEGEGDEGSGSEATGEDDADATEDEDDAGASGDDADADEDDVPADDAEGDDGAVTGTSGGGSDSATDAGSAPTGGPQGQVGDWIREALAVLQAEGVPLDKTDPDDIATIIEHESGGDPEATNDWDSNADKGTPSQGLMQTIGPTFDAHKLPGHGEITDPVDNIIAGVRYAIDRYGSVSQVPGVEAVARGDAYVGY